MEVFNINCYDMVDVETGRKIPIWRTFVFPNRKLYFIYLSCGL